MQDYHNSVSDKLVVCSTSSHSNFFIYNKENQLKHYANELDVHAHIFNQTFRVRMNSNFVLMPNEHINHSDYFSLSYQSHNQLATQQLEDMKVVYDVDEDGEVALVNSSIETDIAILSGHAKKKSKPEALYFFWLENVLTVLVAKDGKTVLANRYQAENQDELFYYIMLVVEQLGLDAPRLYTECISSNGNHEEFLVLFKNYLPSIQLANALVYANIEEASKNPVQFFMSQCVL